MDARTPGIPSFRQTRKSRDMHHEFVGNGERIEGGYKKEPTGKKTVV
jgi:hypothetical protein